MIRPAETCEHCRLHSSVSQGSRLRDPQLGGGCASIPSSQAPRPLLRSRKCRKRPLSHSLPSRKLSTLPRQAAQRRRAPHGNRQRPTRCCASSAQLARRTGAGVQGHAGERDPHLRGQVRVPVAVRGRWVSGGRAARHTARHGRKLSTRAGHSPRPAYPAWPPRANAKGVSSPRYHGGAGIPRRVRAAGRVADLGGARTLLLVPMLKESQLVGAITIYRQEIRPFTDKHVELITNFASQAVIAIENTRLLKELRQRTDDLGKSLEQQTATSEVLSVISGSSGELQPVFDSMLENALRICEAKFGVLFRFDDEVTYPVAMLNLPPVFDKYLRQRERRKPRPGSDLDILCRSRQVIHTTDMLETSSSVPPAKLGGARTQLAVPMLKDDGLVGAIVIYRQEVRALHRKTNRLGQKLRRPGRHRHREHAAAQRTPQIAAAADRHRRRAQGDQPLDLRSANRARYPR